ncbi:hypothetical protein D7X74_21245 [Corallococcus sp. CA047B]|uniref:DUF6948 domain-containing protein n=1 Tax=Corallococcus sp. CA047B TaxID=2316729 RepID=UPI000EA1D625|nr:hypothetical protein [Corallococcus sp. CA047B]RKH13776.1 hypothetical protein D7X74_21245 [Corallococcus sp. CA047B]
MATKKTAAKQVVVISKPVGSSWARVLQGTLVEYDRKSGHAVLTGARQALYYGKETGGEVGLAVNGPKSGSRIGPKLPGRCETPFVVLVLECTPEAAKAWEQVQ